MTKVNYITEKEYRDRQTQFGHLHKSLTLEDWLDQTYNQDQIRKDRYFRVAEKFLDTDETLNVLEIAAGVGDFVIFCEKNFPKHKYFAHELSEPQLKGNISKVAEYFGVSRIPELSFSPVENLDYDNSKFDLIFIKASVHHFEDPNKGFQEIYRVLRTGGRVVFFEDPVCLNIPIYKYFKKKFFSLEERTKGINEHIYSTDEYKLFGINFSKRYQYLDEELVDEFDRQQLQRNGLKKFLGNIIRNNSMLFFYFMVWRFSPVIFVFEK
ncbi:MAG: class I SAM-dependent methyltransferase [Minisyncoccota bacterium]